MSHSHSFHSWPFRLSYETGVFSTRQVMEGLEPVREVYHERNGDWQFLCGTTLDSADLRWVCLGCMVERDITIGELADMLPGWCATRTGQGDEWVQEPYTPRNDEVHAN